MIIRHVSNPENENYIRFEAVDAQNDVQGVCRVEKSCCTRLFPARPLQVRIDMSDAGEQQALLMGAAMAFAVQSADMPARFYVPCDPEDKDNIDMLKIYDFRNDDGVVRMARSIDHIPENPEIPENMTIVRDRLEDAQEAGYFLKRYNRLFDVQRSMKLVEYWRSMPGFRRYLAIDDEGLLGEVLVAQEGSVGKILFIQVNGQSCKLGIGSYLMKLAIHMLAKNGAKRIECDVRVSINGIMRFLKKHGFAQDELLQCNLGINWDPEVERDMLSRRIREQEQMEERGEWKTSLKSDIRYAEEDDFGPIAQDPSDWDL